MVNRVILIGNVGKDPEVRQVGDSAVAKFTLATSESYKNKAGERVTNTEWHNCTVWGKLTDVVSKYVKKGQQLCVEGKIHNGSYDDKDGGKKYFTEIRVENLTMLGRREEKEEEPKSGKAPESELPSDDLPF